ERWNLGADLGKSWLLQVYYGDMRELELVPDAGDARIPGKEKRRVMRPLLKGHRFHRLRRPGHGAAQTSVSDLVGGIDHHDVELEGRSAVAAASAAIFCDGLEIAARQQVTIRDGVVAVVALLELEGNLKKRVLLRGDQVGRRGESRSIGRRLHLGDLIEE